MPENVSLRSCFGISPYRLAYFYNLSIWENATEFSPLLRKYYDCLIAHHIMPDSPEDTYPAVNESNGEIDFNISYPTGTAAQNLGYYMNKLNSYQLPIWEDWPWEDALGNDRNKTKT